MKEMKVTAIMAAEGWASNEPTVVAMVRDAWSRGHKIAAVRAVMGVSCWQATLGHRAEGLNLEQAAWVVSRDRKCMSCGRTDGSGSRESREATRLAWQGDQLLCQECVTPPDEGEGYVGPVCTICGREGDASCMWDSVCPDHEEESDEAES